MEPISVTELLDLLQTFPPDLPVYLNEYPGPVPIRTARVVDGRPDEQEYVALDPFI